MTSTVDNDAFLAISAFGRHVTITVSSGDIFLAPVDAIALKYAQTAHGTDREALHRLRMSEKDPELPPPGTSLEVASGGGARANTILLIGTVPISQFDYAQIRDFTRRAVLATATSKHRISDLALTVHGVGTGLDETEAFKAQLAGMVDVLRDSAWPEDLTRITIVERDVKRADRLARMLIDIPPQAISDQPRKGAYQLGSFESAGVGSRDKPHVFVVMPINPDTEDRYYYGIGPAVRAAGFLCERIDIKAFTGDIMSTIRQRIASAAFVVADLSGANPNVYLEVGYAWGRGVPTILLCGAVEELAFDVRGEKCLLFKSIKALETALSAELEILAKQRQ